MKKTKREDIISVAESLIRKGGYHGFSFRDIAKIVNIKSASIHYYFPTKASLVGVIAKEYTIKFMEQLGEPKDIFEKGEDPIYQYIKVFKGAYFQDKKMCLCGFLGVESDILPDEVHKEIKCFFQKNIQWLSDAYVLKGMSSPKQRAFQTLSLLEGSMISSKVLQDDSLLNIVDHFIH